MYLSPQHAQRDPKNVEYPGHPLLPGQIRLIRLLPGAWTDPIQCELFEDHGTTKYEALSYVWGSQNVTRPIFLDRKEFFVTYNLEGALRHLREQFKNDHKASIFWIDALCINQKDTEERTKQVQLMGDIYRRCEQVIVYLGDRLDGRQRSDKPPAIIKFDRYDAHPLGGCDEDADWDAINVFALFQSLARDRHLTKVPVFGSDYFFQRRPRKTKPRVNYNDRLRLFEALRRMMHPPFTPWWSRVWVIQEVTVAPKILLVYGTLSAHWEMIRDGASIYTRHSRYCCSEMVTKSLPRDQANVLTDSCNRILGIAESRLQNRDHFLYPTQSLLDLLRQFRDRRASDPRDKVYALLGFPRTHTTTPPLTPDYSLGEAEVFRLATLQCIFETGNLSVFSSDLARKFRNDLPSWVPDWSAPGGPTYEARAMAAALYNAMPFSGAEFEEVVRPVGKAGLLVEALKIGTILKIDDVMWGGDTPSIWQSTLLRWKDAASTFYTDKMSGMQDFWRLLCGDVIARYHGMRQEGSRAQNYDELAFMMWASTSPKSPFTFSQNDDVFWPMLRDGYWSTESKIWKAIQLLWPELPRTDLGDLFLDTECLNCWIKDQRPEDLVPHSVVNQENQDEMIRMLLDLLKDELGTEIMASPESTGCWENLPWKDILIHSVRRMNLDKAYSISLDPEHHRGRVPAFDNSMMAATLSRRLIMSDKYMGLGPAGAREGDELFFLKGGNTPFVLRDISAHLDRAPSPQCELIGDCYIQGLMDIGNIAKDDPRGKWETITLV